MQNRREKVKGARKGRRPALHQEYCRSRTGGKPGFDWAAVAALGGDRQKRSAAEIAGGGRRYPNLRWDSAWVIVAAR